MSRTVLLQKAYPFCSRSQIHIAQISVPGWAHLCPGGLWDFGDTNSLRNTRHKDAHRSCSLVAQTPLKLKPYLQSPRTFKEPGKLMAFPITDYGFSLGGWADSPRNTVENHPGFGQLTFFLYCNRVRGTRNGEHVCPCVQVSTHPNRPMKLHQQKHFYIATFLIWKYVFNAVNLVMPSRNLCLALLLLPGRLGVGKVPLL